MGDSLQQSEASYRLLFEAESDAIVIVDAESRRIVDANPAAVSLYGYSRAELLQMKATELSAEPDKSDQHIREVVAGIPARVSPVPVERMHRKKDGSTFPVEISSGFYEVEGRKLLCGIIRDVTERKRLEEQLLISQKMEAIGRLVGGIAHDFNNLLNVITGYSDVILYEMEADNPLRANLDEISKAAGKAANLTKQLLAFSSKRVLRPKVLDLSDIVRGMQEMLRRLIGEDIELKVKYSPRPARFSGDPGLIEQVIMNLAVNARDAMPGGGKLIIETDSIELDDKYMAQEGSVESGAYVMLAMTDTGCGMDREVRNRIFEPFFTTKADGKGTGLGLSTAYGIVRQSAGHILVYTTPGQGTTFKIYLPRVEGEVDREVIPEASALRGTETVLVVEDEEMIRGLICKILRMFGYQVLEVGEGGQAPSVCENHRGEVHLLLTDVVMPEISGRELADELTKLRPGMKVVYMSGYTDDAIVHHGILEGGTTFLQKPFSASTLAAKVREILDS